MKAKRLVENLLVVVSVLLFVWFFASWCNVLMHNDPIYGDYQYAPWNMFTSMAKWWSVWR